MMDYMLFPYTMAGMEMYGLFPNSGFGLIMQKTNKNRHYGKLVHEYEAGVLIAE